MRLGDLNLLISSQITDNSRIMFVRDPVAMAEKAAPFLSFDHDPYAVINKSGGIDWIINGYTTTANYPYSQNADTQQVAIGSTLPGSYNYVRNSVEVVIDAYSGKMTFYDLDPKDPILQAYSAAFPGMFKPLSDMSSTLQAHLRYPSDIFSIQSAIYGRYHLINPQTFYAASTAWQLSPTAGAGPQSQALLAENTYNNQGQLVSTTPARMAPQYQVYSLPGTTRAAVHRVRRLRPGVGVDGLGQQPELQPHGVHGGTVRSRPLRPARPLRGAPGDTRPRQRGCGDLGQPGGVGGDHVAEPKGSQVLLGETLMVPIGNSMVYLRPLYTAASTNPQPQLAYVIAVLGKNVGFEKTLSQALSDVLKTTVTVPTGGGSRRRGRCRRRWRASCRRRRPTTPTRRPR